MKKIRHILIVDGYNVINSWENLQTLANESLELAREKLNAMISEYTQYKGIKSLIVYDAYRVKDSKNRYEKIKNLEVVFTKENETADSYIEKYITNLSQKRYLDISVVTDDMSVQQVSLGGGATRISTVELFVNVKSTNAKIKEKIKKSHTGKTTLDSFVDEETRALLDKMRKKDV